jgi:hypothetical protein
MFWMVFKVIDLDALEVEDDYDGPVAVLAQSTLEALIAELREKREALSPAVLYANRRAWERQTAEIEQLQAELRASRKVVEAAELLDRNGTVTPLDWSPAGLAHRRSLIANFRAALADYNRVTRPVEGRAGSSEA